MTKRTTPEAGALCNDRTLTAERRGPSMTVQHNHTSVGSNIFIQGADTPNPTYMMCFGRIAGEPSADTEQRWNQLAEQMWQWGLEPPEDEPFYTVVEDGVVWDHYTLHTIRDYSYSDDRPLHV